MKNARFIILGLMLGLLVCGTGELNAMDPVMGLRLQKKVMENSSESSGINTDTCIYHYRAGQFSIVDSMTLEQRYYYTPSTQYLSCETIVSYPEPGHHRFDFSYHYPDGRLYSNEGYETDQLGRKVYEYISSGSSSVIHYYPAEMSMAADSLVYKRTAGANIWQTKLVYEYDSLGRRDKGHVYSTLNDAPWTYVGYYQNVYSGLLPFQIDTGEWGFDMDITGGKLAWMLDKRYRIESMEYHPVTGDPTTMQLGFSQTDDGFKYLTSHHDDYGSSYRHIGFHSNGKLNFSHSSSGDEWHFSGSTHYYYWEEAPVAVADEVNIPSPQIGEIYPNPFKGRLNIVLSSKGPASMQVYNIKGRLLVQREITQGSAVWDGRDDSGRQLAAGIYLLRLSQDGIQQTSKCVMMK